MRIMLIILLIINCLYLEHVATQMQEQATAMAGLDTRLSKVERTLEPRNLIDHIFAEEIRKWDGGE